MRTLYILIIAAIAASCNTSPNNEPFVYNNYSSVHELEVDLQRIAKIEDSSEQSIAAGILWDSLRSNKRIPFAINDSVMFLYKGTEQNNGVSWAGDFNWWSATQNAATVKMVRLGSSKIFYYTTTFPPDARLDYKAVVDGQWILDPANPNIQYSGFGPNSELRMPQWNQAQETIPIQDVTKGNLSEDHFIKSSLQNLNYTVAYKVYTPHNYQQKSNLPVIYVTDGHEYSNDRLGAMIIVLDNLIYQEKIEPIIAVFIDPREPGNLSNNRRMSEYAANPKFANFVADELVGLIDNTYKTDPTPSKRAILGTSMGGWISAYIGLTRSDKFQLVGIHSPAFDDAIVSSYNQSPKLPLQIFMSTGTINDTQDRALRMKAVLDAKGYSTMYIEVNEGHSWGNWRALIEEPLTLFFKKGKSK